MPIENGSARRSKTGALGQKLPGGLSLVQSGGRPGPSGPGFGIGEAVTLTLGFDDSAAVGEPVERCPGEPF
jgi:hypothetical protein